MKASCSVIVPELRRISRLSPCIPLGVRVLQSVTPGEDIDGRLMRRDIEGKVLLPVVETSKDKCVAGDGAITASSTDGHFCRRADECTNVMCGRGAT